MVKNNGARGDENRNLAGLLRMYDCCRFTSGMVCGGPERERVGATRHRAAGVGVWAGLDHAVHHDRNQRLSHITSET